MTHSSLPDTHSSLPNTYSSLPDTHSSLPNTSAMPASCLLVMVHACHQQNPPLIPAKFY